MLTRRVARPLAAGSVVSIQRRYDHDRWYGHAIELDLYAYKYTGEPPMWMKPTNRNEKEHSNAKALLPKIEWCSAYEALLRDADRLHPHLNRKEFGNEVKIRLEKQANSVARSQTLIAHATTPMEPHVEDTMIARIIDEEHVQAEMKVVKCVRANEVAEDNRLDILPGGSPTSLREKTRWNVNMELHPIDRAEIAARLTAWLPEKYHIVYFDDYQSIAAVNPAIRKDMLKVVDNVEKEHAEEAKKNGWEADLRDTCEELRGEVDPTRHITASAIKEQTSLDTLEEWSRAVHEYNGDERIFQIYARAAELTKNKEHADLVATLKKQYEAK